MQTFLFKRHPSLCGCDSNGAIASSARAVFSEICFCRHITENEPAGQIHPKWRSVGITEFAVLNPETAILQPALSQHLAFSYLLSDSEGQQLSALSLRLPKEGDGTKRAALLLDVLPCCGSKLFHSHVSTHRKSEGKRKEQRLFPAFGHCQPLACKKGGMQGAVST